MKKLIIIIASAVVLISLLLTIVFVLLSKKSFGKPQVAINNQTFSVEVAMTREERAKGLSGRKKLEPDQAMLFVFEEYGFHSFWMKDMEIPLDIIFIKDDRIVTIHRNIEKPGKDEPLEYYVPKEAANFVLEISGGLSDKHDFKEGDSVKIENTGN